MDGLVLKILNMSITATLTALAVMLLRLPLRKAPRWISYALWGVVLFRLVCPFSFSSAFSLLGRIGAPAAEDGIVSYIPEAAVYPAAAQTEPDTVIPDAEGAIGGARAQEDAPRQAGPSVSPAEAGAVLWLLGVSAMLAYSVISYALLRRRLSDATLLTDGVFETDAVSSPFVCGLARPRIYLPVGLPAAEREYVLLHERIHIRRKDYLVKPLAFLALSAHWFNPVMWLSFRLMCRDMEMSCDERAVRALDPAGRASYSAALLRLATGRPILAGSPLAFGESGAKRRVQNILTDKKPAVWAVAAAIFVCAAAAVFLLANPAETLALPAADAVLSVDLEAFSGQESLGAVRITDRPGIEAILSALSGARKTSRQSAGDFPAQDDCLAVRLSLADGQRTLYLYGGENAYYIEEPYAGVYRSGGDADAAVRGIYAGGAQSPGVPAAVYAFDACLYVNPSTSYYPVNGTGQLYYCGPDSFAVVDESTGQIQKTYALAGWMAHAVDADEWARLFQRGAVDIEGYPSRREYDIDGDYRLYQMDGEVWLGRFSGDILLRLYRLQKTDLSLSDLAGRAGVPPENAPLRAESPDGAYTAEAYGTNTDVTAAGLYPYAGLRVIRNADGTAVWNGSGYYRAEFLWSGDSQYVAVYGEARTRGECFLVEAETGQVIGLPDLDLVSAQPESAAQPDAARPDPYFRVTEWTDDTTVRVGYRWTAQDGAQEASGTYAYDIVRGEILSNTCEISDFPG